MGKPFVSVLIDTYNHERFIEQAIVSVLEQDFAEADREIIVVDDGSVDGTPEIVKRFGSRVRSLRKANGGQASAFNEGIPECRGEIVAFLDGDDWWAPGKLKAVSEALEGEPAVGIVGHGITEVYTDGREHSELLREAPRFRIDSEKGARLFRLRKSFLGSSRMTLRAEVARRIGQVPEALRIEADEYLFTLGAVFSDALILPESLTFYRLHENNAFQISNGDPAAHRRKREVLQVLANALQKRLKELGLAEEVVKTVVESVAIEATLIRLATEGGYPWQTVRAELRSYRITNENAGLGHWLFKCIALLPACVLPAKRYYTLRQSLSTNTTYRKAREKWLPFLQAEHVERIRTPRP
ncbi:MAG TPA: glycosyltransferase family A protein [Candidatus Dormibacteraeota bacterium]|nr:glycosyltransferase family A protein [Candidatus Dormibacteraeota bacterium]